MWNLKITPFVLNIFLMLSLQWATLTKAPSFLHMVSLLGKCVLCRTRGEWDSQWEKDLHGQTKALANFPSLPKPLSQ